MKNKLIIALVVIIGFSMVGCKHDDKDEALVEGTFEGTWKHEGLNDDQKTDRFIFDGDEYILTSDNVNINKGMFTVSGSKITFNTTHVWNTSYSDWTEWPGGASEYTFEFLSSTKFTLTLTDEGFGYQGTWTKVK
jgi:hypothetical protein